MLVKQKKLIGQATAEPFGEDVMNIVTSNGDIEITVKNSVFKKLFSEVTPKGKRKSAAKAPGKRQPMIRIDDPKWCAKHGFDRPISARTGLILYALAELRQKVPAVIALQKAQHVSPAQFPDSKAGVDTFYVYLRRCCDRGLVERLGNGNNVTYRLTQKGRTLASKIAAPLLNVLDVQ